MKFRNLIVAALFAGAATLALAAPAQATETQPVTFADHCDGSTTVSMHNPGEHLGITYTIGEAPHAVNPGDTATVVIPAPKSSDILVKLAGVYKPGEPSEPVADTQRRVQTRWSHEWAQPKDCPLWAAELTAACTGFAITAGNPLGNPPMSVKIQWADKSLDMAVQPGESRTTDHITAVAPVGVKVSYTYEHWTSQPESVELVYGAAASCSPSASPPMPGSPPANGGGGGSQLPLTGTGVTGFAVTGAALAVLGAVVWLVARRRRVTFAA
jgi:LPXTG-motif cell wall-anchored protein